MAVMRRSMLPGLLRAVARNQNHQRTDGGLFEIGRTYAPREDGQADERRFLAAVRFGRVGADGGWRDQPRPVDVFAATGLATALARAAGVRVEPRPNDAPYFHPVRQARLVAGDDVIGWAAEMHPLVLRAFAVAGPVAAVVLDLDALDRAAPPPPGYEDLLTVPVSHRDLALVVSEGVPAAQLLDAARRGRRGAAARGARVRPLRGRAGRRGPREPGAAPDAGRSRAHPDRRGDRGGRRPGARRARGPRRPPARMRGRA